MSCLSSDEDLSYSEDDYFNNDDDSSEEISDEYEEDTNDINDDYLCDMQKLLAEDYHIETTTKDDSSMLQLYFLYNKIIRYYLANFFRCPI